MIRSWNNAFLRLQILGLLLVSTGNPAFCQAAKPPNRAAVFSIPFDFMLTAEPADVCSFGQEQ
jgi:hypothetical protein